MCGATYIVIVISSGVVIALVGLGAAARAKVLARVKSNEQLMKGR